MKTIRYIIEFYSWWHCGSGQASGSDLDELVIKDKDNLPYVPGRSIKGLLRDACDELYRYGYTSDEDIKRVFGYFAGNKDEAIKGSAFFSDAVLPEKERALIGTDEHLWQGLYDSVSFTKIDKDGIAEEHSLRKIQVTVPCTLEGTIEGVPEEFEEALKNAMKLVKRLGTGRHHGFGRCRIYTI